LRGISKTESTEERKEKKRERKGPKREEEDLRAPRGLLSSLQVLVCEFEFEF
jgi:hypothetical protein